MFPLLKKHSFLFLFFFSLLIRILYAYYFADEILLGDAKGYYDNALYLLGKKEHYDFKWISFWSPGEYLYLMPWIYFLGQAKWVVVSSMLAIWAAFFYVFEKWASLFLVPKTIFVILLIFSIFPTFIHHSVSPLTHLPATVCMLAIFYAIHKKKGIISGVLLGFLLLIRPANLLLAFVFPFFIKSPKALFLSYFMAFLTTMLWSGYLYSKINDFVFVSESNGYNLYMGNHPETPKYATWWWATHTWDAGSVLKRESDSLLLLPPGKIGNSFQALAIDYIKQQPLDFVIRSLNRMRSLFAFDTFTGSMLAEKHSKSLIFAIIGLDAIFYLSLMCLFILFWLLPIQANSLQFFFGTSLFCIAVPYFFSFSHPTYHFSMLPILAVGAGIFWEKKQVVYKDIPHWKKAMALSVFLIFIVIQMEWVYFWLFL